MDLSPKSSDMDMDMIEEAATFFESLLATDELNPHALYGKSLILYIQGNIGECAEYLTKVQQLAIPEDLSCKIKAMKGHVLSLLGTNQPILDELEKRLSDIKQDPFFLTFMTIPKSSTTSLLEENYGIKYSAGRSTSCNLKTDSNSLICTVCLKTFSRVFSLNRHMMSHNGERNHSCRYVIA